MQAEMDDEEAEFDHFTSTWSLSSQPDWNKKISSIGGVITFVISTSSTPFVYVALGTRKRAVFFPGGYSAKSTPGSLEPRPGAPYTKRFHTRREAKNYKIKARRTHFLLAQKRRKAFRDRMQLALIAGTQGFFR